jgi:hypothetical protein
MPCRGHACLHLQIGSLLFSVEFIILTTHPRPRLLPSALIIYPYWGMAKVSVKNGWAWQLPSLVFLWSLLINFKLDIRLHFVSWLSVSRGCYVISSYHSLGHTFHTLLWSLQSVSINFKLDIGLHFVLWLSISRTCYLILPYHSWDLTLFTCFSGLSNPSQSTLS